MCRPLLKESEAPQAVQGDTMVADAADQEETMVSSSESAESENESRQAVATVATLEWVLICWYVLSWAESAGHVQGHI